MVQYISNLYHSAVVFQTCNTLSRQPKLGQENTITTQAKVNSITRAFLSMFDEGQVIEDETEAAKYCDLLQRGGQGCEWVVEVGASSVIDMCQKMKAFVVLFRRGRTPPLPESLNLF